MKMYKQTDITAEVNHCWRHTPCILDENAEVVWTCYMGNARPSQVMPHSLVQG